MNRFPFSLHGGIEEKLLGSETSVPEDYVVFLLFFTSFQSSRHDLEAFHSQLWVV